MYGSGGGRKPAPLLCWNRMLPVALTIAGSDPSGGAGIQADLKTFHRFGVYGEAVITLITVQNTTRVSRIEVMAPALVVIILKVDPTRTLIISQVVLSFGLPLHISTLTSSRHSPGSSA